MTIRIAVMLAVSVIAGGCRGLQVDDGAALARDAAENANDAGTRKDVGGGVNTVTEAEASAVAAAMRQSTPSRLDYKISPADLVSVTVYEVPEMSRRARVNASGIVFLPLVGGVEVGGKSLGAAQSLIEHKLQAYVVKPQVTLFIEEYGNRRVSVMGEVQRPGSYPIPTESRMTILEAISTAGGFTPVAAQDRARVIRYVNGETMKYTIDIRDLMRGDNKDLNMVLEPNDVVFVPQSLF